MNVKLLSILGIAGMGCILSLNAQSFKSSSFSSINARQIGPAVMSGRITAIEGTEEDPNVLYVGAAAGGIWKSITGGTLFKPVFDKHNQSIGALAIDQKRPDTLWAGTGESNMRNSVSVGDGIYRSTDAGENWVKCGLEKSEHISKILIHPNDPSILYVAVPGALWSDSEDRGLYQSTDFGKSWNKILYGNPRTGCADVLMDPRNPDVLYASLWEFRRTPWSFSSGGEGSGLFKSTDGGKNWQKIQKGFLPGTLGRICLALAPTEPDHIYAIAEGKETYLYSSTNGGAEWVKESASPNVTARPFYFSLLVVDPTDAKRIYRPAFSLSISDDGGKSFYDASMQGGWVHPDHHALWINPKNNQHMYLGTDGGAYVSFDRGINWLFLNNLPLSQFYHATYDLQKPYHIYGGLQDNGSWSGPSESDGGIENKDWANLYGGDGFWVQPDLKNPEIVFCEYQGGHMVKVNTRTKEVQDLQPQAGPGEPKLRFNWNTPLLTSPTRPEVLYCGAQYVYRSTNQGSIWEKISPDLTTNDPDKQKQEESGGLSVDNSSAENHCTVFTIAESPLDKDLIWAGTDDGNLQVTTNGGKSWTNMSPKIPGLPPAYCVSSVEPSPHKRERIYVTFDGHGLGDIQAWVFQSEDLGNTWTRLSGGDLKGFAHKVKEDPINAKLLFVGTEFGLYMSIDGGKNWAMHKANVPPVPVRDIAIHPVTHDLILATHGRGIIIHDDLTPFRALNETIFQAPVAFLPSRAAVVDPSPLGGGFPAAGGFVGANPDNSAQIWYVLKDRIQTGDVIIEISDLNGNFIQSIPGTKRKGINMISWNMRRKAPRVAYGAKADVSGIFGPLVAPGTYKVKLITPTSVLEKDLVLKAPEGKGHSAEDLKAQQDMVQRIYDFQESLAFLSFQIKGLQDSLKRGLSTMKAGSGLHTKGLAYQSKLQELHNLLSAGKETTAITGEEKIREKASALYLGITGYAGRPTQSQYNKMEALDKEKAEAQAKFETLWEKELKTFSNQWNKAKLPELKKRDKGDFDRKS